MKSTYYLKNSLCQYRKCPKGFRSHGTDVDKPVATVGDLSRCKMCARLFQMAKESDRVDKVHKEDDLNVSLCDTNRTEKLAAAEEAQEAAEAEEAAEAAEAEEAQQKQLQAERFSSCVRLCPTCTHKVEPKALFSVSPSILQASSGAAASGETAAETGESCAKGDGEEAECLETCIKEKQQGSSFEKHVYTREHLPQQLQESEVVQCLDCEKFWQRSVGDIRKSKCPFCGGTPKKQGPSVATTEINGGLTKPLCTKNEKGGHGGMKNVRTCTAKSAAESSEKKVARTPVTPVKTGKSAAKELPLEIKGSRGKRGAGSAHKKRLKHSEDKSKKEASVAGGGGGGGGGSAEGTQRKGSFFKQFSKKMTGRT